MVTLLVIVLISLLILVHELGHFFVAKLFGIKVEEFGFGFPPHLFKKKIGETVYSINLFPFGGFVKIYGEEEHKDAEEKDKKRMFFYQKTRKKSSVLLAGILMNIVLGWIALSAVFMIGTPQHLLVTSVASDSPAKEAGLRAGDFILNAEKGNLFLSDPIETTEFIDFVEETPSADFNLLIQREGEEKNIEISGRANPPKGEGSFGITIVDTGVPQHSFFSAVAGGAVATASTLKFIVIGFYNIISGIFVSPDIIDNLAGPVGIFVVAKQTGAASIVYLVRFFAVISLNLAVLNLIPFPALDGGRFLIVLAEKIKKSPVSYKTQAAINTVGLLLLVALMVFVTINDVGRFL